MKVGKWQRLLSFVISLVLIIGLIPGVCFEAYAEDTPAVPRLTSLNVTGLIYDGFFPQSSSFACRVNHVEFDYYDAPVVEYSVNMLGVVKLYVDTPRVVENGVATETEAEYPSSGSLFLMQASYNGEVTDGTLNSNFVIAGKVDGENKYRSTTSGIQVQDMNGNNYYYYLEIIPMADASENHAPTIKSNAPGTAEVMLGESWTIDLTTIFEDEDNDPLTYSVSINGGASTELPEDTVEYSYTPETVGTVELVFTANDGKAASAPHTVTLTVNEAVAAVPKLTSLNVTGLIYDGFFPQSSSFACRVNHVEFDYYDAPVVEYSVNMLGVVKLYVDTPRVVENGVATETEAEYPSSGSLFLMQASYNGEVTDGTLNSNFVIAGKVDGENKYRSTTSGIQVQDMNGNNYYYYLEIIPMEDAPENHAPAIKDGVPTSLTVQIKKNWTIDLSTVFEDPDGDTLTYFYGDSIDVAREVTGGVFGTSYIFAGTKTYTFYAYDGIEYSQPFVFSVNYDDSNWAPVIKEGVVNPVELTMAVGQEFKVDLSTIFEDPNGDRLTYYVSIAGAEAVSTNGSYTPQAAGATTLAFTAKDSELESNVYTVILTAKDYGTIYQIETLESNSYSVNGNSKPMGHVSVLLDGIDVGNASPVGMGVTVEAISDPFLAGFEPNMRPVYDFGFDHWEITGVDGIDINANPITFDMPANDISIKAVFVQKGSKVTVSSNNGSYVSFLISGFSDSSNIAQDQVSNIVAAGAVIECYADVTNQAYYLPEWIITNVTTGDPVEVTYVEYNMNGLTFTKPQFTVDGTSEYTAEAVFEPKDYGDVIVTVNDAAMGTASASAGGEASTNLVGVVIGQTVTLTAEAKEGYLFKSWTASFDGTAVEITDANNPNASFMMPATDHKAVNVVATFEKDPNFASSDCDLTDAELTDLSSSTYAADQDGTSFTITLPAGTDVSSLANWKLNLEISEGATVAKNGDATWTNGAACDMALNTPATFTVTAEDGTTTQDYTIVIAGEEVKDGWILIDGAKYYYENGKAKTGWHKEDGKWYYLDPDQEGAMATGKVKAGSAFYIMDESGVMQTGWIKDNGVWYFAKDSGALATGWLQSGSTWYYLNPETCVMETGWVKVNGTWYYLKESGAMAIGWVKDGDTWYYMNTSGAMVTGWVKVNNTWYYMKSSGAMAANEWCDGYWLNANGSWTYQPRGSWKQNSTGWWFGDTSGWYAKSTTQKINGVNYTFNAAGYWVQ